MKRRPLTGVPCRLELVRWQPGVLSSECRIFILGRRQVVHSPFILGRYQVGRSPTVTREALLHSD